jgi:hypothetical protein
MAVSDTTGWIIVYAFTALLVFMPVIEMWFKKHFSKETHSHNHCGHSITVGKHTCKESPKQHCKACVQENYLKA